MDLHILYLEVSVYVVFFLVRRILERKCEYYYLGGVISIIARYASKHAVWREVFSTVGEINSNLSWERNFLQSHFVFYIQNVTVIVTKKYYIQSNKLLHISRKCQRYFRLFCTPPPKTIFLRLMSHIQTLQILSSEIWLNIWNKGF